MLKKHVSLLYLGAFALCILTILNLFLINEQLHIGIILILYYIITLFYVGINYKKRNIERNLYTKLWLLLAVLAVISEAIWMILQIYGFVILSNILHITNFLLMFTLSLQSSFHEKPFQFRPILGKWKILLVTTLSTVGTLVMVVMLVNQISPRPLVSILQASMNITNSYTAEESTETVLDDGSIYINDVLYDDSSPNGYLDIYQTVHHTNSAPTFIFIHGGGYVWGDKTGENQNQDNPEVIAYIKEVLNRGYNVIALNYAFAPEYHYPTPLKQVTEAVSFLQQNAKKYALNMNNVVIGGQSAGAQLAGQFVNIQTNSDYAAEMEIQPVLSEADIKAVVFNSGLYDASRFDQTDSVTSNYRFNMMGRSYFNVNNLEDSKIVEQSNVIKHITGNFPPTFMSDGNTGTFNNQAKELAEKLTKLGVKHKLNLYSKSIGKLPHGFENEMSKYAKENLQIQMDFVDSVVMQ